MNFRDEFQEGSEALMAWLQSALKDADRVKGKSKMQYGISASSATIDMDYMIDEWNVSLVRITAVEREGKIKLEIKRFAGPRSEAYDAANEWRESLG